MKIERVKEEDEYKYPSVFDTTKQRSSINEYFVLHKIILIDFNHQQWLTSLQIGKVTISLTMAKYKHNHFRTTNLTQIP